MNAVSPIATLLLAAGASSRLGRAKQLLPYRGQTLLRHAAETALEAGLGPVFVVLGCRETECRATLAGLAVEMVTNPNWEEGMGTSIAAGMQRVEEAAFRGVLLALGDQPHVGAENFRALAAAFAGHEIAASEYAGSLGPPALFSQKLFAQLRALRGSQGAKGLIQKNGSVAICPCPRAEFDIDTDADFQNLQMAAR